MKTPEPEHEPGFKCATFDAAMQAAIPPDIRARMDRDRKAAQAAKAKPVCEWCETELRDPSRHTETEPGVLQCVGDCVKCRCRTWSKPVAK